MPEKRTSKKRQQELAKAEEDALSSDEDDDAGPPVMYAFTDADNDGDMDRPPPAVARPRKKREYATGQDKKDADLHVVHVRGDRMTALDGVVRINLAKCVLRPVTTEEIALKKFRGKTALIDETYWRCLLPRTGDHPEFVAVGTGNTGNLMKHCNEYHEPLIEALARLIKETPATEAQLACTQFILGQRAPVTGMERFLGRNNDRIASETLCLIWFLDANIAFSQFDNPLFKSLISLLSGKVFPSSTTMVEGLLPMLYNFCIAEMKAKLATCRSFFNSYDCWTRRTQRFVSQTYYGISVSTFDFHVLALDLVFCPAQHFAEVLAGCLAERQELWTANMKPEPIAAGGIADGASDVQKAGKLLWGDKGDDDDMSRCQNHRLKSMYEMVEQLDKAFAADLHGLCSLFVAVSNGFNANQVLKAYQHAHALSSAALYVYNETRWEGRCKILECALKLRDSLPVLKDFAAAQKLVVPHDFLQPAYFIRLDVYHRHLARVNVVSKLFQTQSYPTGHLVVVTYAELSKHFAAVEGIVEYGFETAFKGALHTAIEEILVKPLYSSANPFLKAALFHPAVCWRLLHEARVSDALLASCRERVYADIAALSGGAESRMTHYAKCAFDDYMVRALL